jgi:hypothetical protein
MKRHFVPIGGRTGKIMPKEKKYFFQSIRYLITGRKIIFSQGVGKL